ncbi:hypothetical protein VTK73DRAFT_3928 [Phialemonium thermophilum]|uniref:Uncharacterized protein n=1 Tax=Phialemonium thermophilum TaxID=223376 RepID=A0ABR3VDG0_9PEZI
MGSKRWSDRKLDSRWRTGWSKLRLGQPGLGDLAGHGGALDVADLLHGGGLGVLGGQGVDVVEDVDALGDAESGAHLAKHRATMGKGLGERIAKTRLPHVSFSFHLHVDLPQHDVQTYTFAQVPKR